MIAAADRAACGDGFRPIKADMTMLSASVANTLAARQAAENFNANRAALRATQPLSLDLRDPPDEWVFARDGSLTAREQRVSFTVDAAPSNPWLAGCSVPMLAAKEVLKTLNVTGPVACFLAPSHAAQVRVALDRMRPE